MRAHSWTVSNIFAFQAVAHLGELRVRCSEIKAEVEAKIEDYKEKIHHARSIEKQIQVICISFVAGIIKKQV